MQMPQQAGHAVLHVPVRRRVVRHRRNDGGIRGRTVGDRVGIAVHDACPLPNAYLL